MSKKKQGSSKVSVDVTPGRAIGALIIVAALCGAAFFAVRAIQSPQAAPPANVPLAATLPPKPATAAQGAATQAPAQVPSGGTDTFDTLNNWQFKVSSGPNYKFSLVNGEFLEEVTGTALHNYFTGEFGAATVEVDARWVGGNEDKNGRYGIVVRRTEKSAYYFEYFPFQDGQWMFQIGQNDKFDVLGKGTVPKAAIRPAGTFSHFKIEMTDKKARIFVNDAQLAEIDISTIPQGAVGLMTTADAGKKAVAGFDNFVVRK